MGTLNVALVLLSVLDSVLSLAHGDGRHIPDFSHYAPTQTLTPPFKSTHKGHQHGRLILVGDVHGSLAPLDRLLSSVSFDSSVDTLITLGDFLEKGGMNNSLETLEYLMHHNAKAVRGNHEQPVIEWRGWISWISSLDSQGRPLSTPSSTSSSLGPPITYPLTSNSKSHTKLSGAEWLSSVTSSFHSRPHSQSRDTFLRIARHHTHPSLFWDLLPPHLTDDMFDDHYLIASSLTPFQYTWLKSLPSLIHIPDLHLFAMHAGLLPLDPTRPRKALGQPLAHAPSLPPSRHPRNKAEKTEMMQVEQEKRLLKGVLQNTRHWTHMHMRSVRKGGSLSGKLTEGVYWADIWGKEMKRCGGFRAPSSLVSDDDVYEDEDEEQDLDDLTAKNKRDMPCHASTAIYGHTAALGLDIRRWSMGLDSGCVYGRRLSALVFDRKSLDTSVKNRRRGRFEGEMQGQVILGQTEEDDDDDMKDDDESEEMKLLKVRRKWVRFGEHGSARLVQVGCPALAEAN